MSNKTLKFFCLISSLVTTVIWVLVYIQLFNGAGDIPKFDHFIHNPNIVTYPLLCVFSIIILVKTNSNKGALLFSLFLSLVSQNIAITNFFIQNPQYEIELILAISFILTSIVYIKSFQNFPQHISNEVIDVEIKQNKFLRVYLKAFLKKGMWFFFSVGVLALSFLFPGNMLMRAILFSIVLSTALFFLFLNFKISTASSRNKITWLFWGILCYTFLAILNSILTYSNPEMQHYIATLFNILRSLSLFISITMCLFFFDTFDTGVLIRRTIVDGAIFITIVFLYNTIEHYFLHWLTHKLHISDALISSVLSGFFVLLFGPIHHKFMHGVGGRLKSKDSVE